MRTRRYRHLLVMSLDRRCVLQKVESAAAIRQAALLDWFDNMCSYRQWNDCDEFTLLERCEEGSFSISRKAAD
jgi:hypothetical protein